MDILALTTFLAPCLPFLLKKVGSPALESAASKLGEDTWQKAQAIWKQLQPKVASEAAATVAAEKLAEKPESAAWTEALQEELASILEKDSELAGVISHLFKDTQAANGGNQVQQSVQENEGQVIGQVFGGEVKNVGNIGSVQGDVTL